MKVVAIIFLLLISSATGYAQTIKGMVKDSSGKAIPYATVSLKNSASNVIAGYTVTDARGSFALTVAANTTPGNLVFEVHSIGYQTAIKKVIGFDVPLEFTLAVQPGQLQEVIVKSSGRPVLRTHGDTLNYKVSDFSGAQDRSIADVLRKMPGITIDADGTIRYNNKPVSAVYVGGDNILDDKYSIATNSIPQLAVNLVQVIENNQPIKALQNKVLSEDVALNLEIKKGAKLHLMGQERVGAGVPGNYDVNLNAMMFRDSYKAINYVAANSIGYDVQQELISHNLAEYNQRVDNAVPEALLSTGAVSTPQLAQNRYLFNQSKVINLNNFFKLKNNVQLKLNGYYVQDRQRQDYSQQTTIFLPTDTVKYNEVQHNLYIPKVLHTQITLNINREKFYLNDVLVMDQKNNRFLSELQTGNSSVNQVLTDNSPNFSNEFNFMRSKLHHIIQAYSYISHSTKPENLAISPGYNAALFNNNVPYTQLVQRVNIPSWYTNNYLSYKLPSGLFTQSYRVGFSVQSQTLHSGLDLVQTNNTIYQPDIISNHTEWTKKKLYGEAAYDLLGARLKANLTLPLTFQHISYSERRHALDKNLPQLYFNPQLRAKYKVGKENYLNLMYSYRNENGTIAQVYPGYILTDYRNLNSNTGDLTREQTHQAGGGFSYRKALKLFFWSVNAVYTHTETNNISSSTISNTIQQHIVLPYANANSSWAGSASVSKYVFALRTTFSGGLQWQSNRLLELQNNNFLPFNITISTIIANADTKLNNKVNLSYKATLTKTHSQSTSAANGVEQLAQQATINYNPADYLQFKLSGEYYFTSRQNNSDLKYFFADASVIYRLKKCKTDFELNAANFLHVKTYNALYLSANTLTASSYSLPGRIIVLKALFNF